MKRSIDYLAVTILFLLGSMHTVLTLLYQRPFDLDALMYTGTGLAFLVLSIFNLARIRSTNRLTATLCAVCNGLTVTYLGLIAAVFADARVLVAVAVMALLVGFSAYDSRQNTA